MTWVFPRVAWWFSIVVQQVTRGYHVYHIFYIAIVVFFDVLLDASNFEISGNTKKNCHVSKQTRAQTPWAKVWTRRHAGDYYCGMLRSPFINHQLKVQWSKHPPKKIAVWILVVKTFPPKKLRVRNSTMNNGTRRKSPSRILITDRRMYSPVLRGIDWKPGIFCVFF